MSGAKRIFTSNLSHPSLEASSISSKTNIDNMGLEIRKDHLGSIGFIDEGSNVIFLSISSDILIGEEKLRIYDTEFKKYRTFPVFGMVLHLLEHETIHLVIRKLEGKTTSTMLDFISFEEERIKRWTE